MSLELFRVESEADREDVFRFRYSVYVEQMGRYKATADHDGRRLVEPEDAHSVIYGARLGGEVVGTARTTFGTDGFSARQLEQYRLRPFLAEVPVELMAIGERLMVAGHLRGSAVTSELWELTTDDLVANRQSDLYAATDGVRILSLSDHTLRTLISERPALAAKLLFNISRMLCARLIKSHAGRGV